MIRNPLTLIFLAFAIFLSSCSVPRRALENVEFTIVQMNDVYEIAPLEGGKAGGLARVATVVRELEKENPNTIAVLAGDFLSPSLIGTLRGDEGGRIFGQQMVETLNALGLDYVTFGNHEFDTSDPEVVQKRIDQSDFKYVVCNVNYLENGKARPFTQRGEPVPPYAVHEFRSPSGKVARVALIGVLLPFNRQPYLQYEPVIESYRTAYRKARAEANVVLALTHLAIDEDIELAREAPGTLLFMGGHDHTNMNHYVEQTVITKADANAKTVYIHRVVYNPATGMAQVRSSLKKIDDTIPEDPATKTVVDTWMDKVDKIMKEMGYRPDRKVLEAKVPLECKESDVRTRQTNYGKLTAQAFRDLWPGAAVYLINSGAMRMDDDIQGVVTEYDVLRTFPFGGEVVRMELPGILLAEVLQIGLSKNRGEGGYFQIIGAEPADGGWLIDGVPLDPVTSYPVVLPKFVADGKENNLGMLGGIRYQSVEAFNAGGRSVRNDVRDMVIWYMEKVGVVE
jgi:2',3'-cyclic-nucleotide 2'-phosphodiesterase (5'-nucleotidase family)